MVPENQMLPGRPVVFYPWRRTGKCNEIAPQVDVDILRVV
jgi:hypothetical protein